MPAPVIQLYLLRHAHAGDSSRWPGDDARRPLSARGHQQADRVARHLLALRINLDVIVTSPRVRARETADPVGRALGVPVVVDERLGGGLTIAILDQVLADAGDPARAMVVGHDPDFSDLAAELAGAISLPMRKGALVRLDTARPLGPAGAILRWLIPPDALVDDQAG